MKSAQWFVFIIVVCAPFLAVADNGVLPALTVVSGKDGSDTYSVTLQILLAMTALTLLPALVMLTTSFTRIIIVLGMLRQAIGMPQTPTNQILIGMALFLSLFVMAPVFTEIQVCRAAPDALRPS